MLLLSHAAVASADGPRPSLQAVSSIRIANYGSPSVVLEGRDRFGPIVGELNALRRKAWRGGDTRLECYSTLVVYSGKKTLGTFRIRPQNIVEREGQKGTPIYSLAIDPAEIPQLTRMLADITPAKDCN